MECSDVLKKFLLEGSELDVILPLDKFASFFPKGTSIELIKDIYLNTKDERNAKCIELVASTIHKEFEAPFESLVSDGDMFSSIVLSRKTIDELILRLNLLLGVCEKRISALDEYNKEEMEKIKEIIEDLKDHNKVNDITNSQNAFIDLQTLSNNLLKVESMFKDALVNIEPKR